MGPALDLTGIRFVDNHCHALEEDQRPASVGAWRSHFTESPHPSMRTRDAADTAFYRRLLHAMTEFYGVADDEQSEQATLAARGRSTTGEIAAALFADAGVAGLVVDTGFPSADTTFAKAALTEATGVQQVDLLRLELLFQDLVVRHHSLRSVEEALLDELDDVRGSGFSGFKSVVGYRTGLGVERWPRAAAESSFADAREEASASGGPPPHRRDRPDPGPSPSGSSPAPAHSLSGLPPAAPALGTYRPCDLPAAPPGDTASGRQR